MTTKTESNEKLDRARNLIQYLAQYFWTEMGWERFRAEFLANGDTEYERVRDSNAHKSAQFMHAMSKQYPEWQEALGFRGDEDS